MGSGPLPPGKNPSVTCFLDVAVPGPWWTCLTYESPGPAAPGCRVKVPVGKGARVGFVLSGSDKPSWAKGEIRPVLEILDENSIFPAPYWDLLSWTGRAFLCGLGQAMKAMVPAGILNGVPMSPCPSRIAPFGKASIETHYRWEDGERTDFYLKMLLEAAQPVLVTFSEHQRAKVFFDTAKKEGLTGGLFWPQSGGASKIPKWQAVRDGEVSYLVGGPGIISAPMVPGTVIIEDEGSDGYRLLRHPRLNVRSILSRMALSSGSRLIMGGRIPSSRVFKELSPLEEPKKLDKRLVFVDIHEARKIDVPGVSKDINLSQGVMERTIKAVTQGRTVLWILDRKGYTGELRCGECASSFTCPCGGAYRYGGGKMTCVRCGKSRALYERCPKCGGLIIVGNLPGLEAYMPVARTMVPEKPVILWSADDPRGTADRKKALDSLLFGGLVLGTRKALELCDTLDIGLICWMDGDSEAGRPDHGARYAAYSMVAESCWRGPCPEKRQVLLQSRAPGRGWQGALTRGWTNFWKREFPERFDLALPPFRYLAEIDRMGSSREKIYRSLMEAGTDVMDPGGDHLWVGFDRISQVYRAMEKFYGIGVSTYPRIVLWTD